MLCQHSYKSGQSYCDSGEIVFLIFHKTSRDSGAHWSSASGNIL